MVILTILIQYFYPSLGFLSPVTINEMESMVNVNRTASVPNSILCYDVDKGQNFVPELNIYPSLISKMKVGGES